MKFRLVHSAVRLMMISMMAFGVFLLPVQDGSIAIAADSLASLTLDVYTCDPGYDPIDPHETLVDPCNHGTEDITFTLDSLAGQSGSASASTGTGAAPATISFSGLTDGDYRLTQQTPDTIARSFILQCTSTVRAFDYPFSPFASIESGGRLNIHLLPGEQLVCDWYNVQTSQSAALTLTAYDCSGDMLGPDVCDLATGIEFELVNSTGGDPQRIVTDAAGIATFYGDGIYRLTAVSELDDRVFCAFEPYDVVIDDQLDLDPARPIAIDAYFCYPGA